MTWIMSLFNVSVQVMFAKKDGLTKNQNEFQKVASKGAIMHYKVMEGRRW